MNLYAAALMAKRDGVMTISPLLFRANDRAEFDEAAGKHCEELYPRIDGYYDLEFVGNEYALLEVLENIQRALTVNGVPAKEKRLDDGLALATLCDMVIDEDAEDRSNWALIKAVGKLIRSCPELDKGE